ncbi:hypothetical protein IAU60_004938 [Kwoniella sp. DSM 27419]
MTAQQETALSLKTPSSGVRSKLACAACRATKVRCLMNETGACMRCLRYGLACTPPAVNKRRGRPRRVSGQVDQVVSDTTPPALIPHVSFDTSVTHMPNVGFPPEYMTLPGPHDYSGGTAHIASTTGIPQNGGHVGINNQQGITYPPPHNDHQQPVSITTGHSSDLDTPKQHRDLDLSEYLDPADKALQVDTSDPFFVIPARASRCERSGSPSAVNRDDPVNLMILSEIEALAMVQLFHDRLNPLVAVLDPKLHTLAYLRNTSTVLFSTVLALASRFGRSDLHPLLLSHAQTLLDRAITSGLAEVGVVQTIMILTYWKAPADTSAWRKIGIALRIGYQLYWHVPRTQRLPDDEMAARKILNVERTWQCLFCFDRSWARQHLYLGESVDMHLAFSVELCKLKDQWRAICESGITSPAYCDAVLESVHAQCEALLIKWWPKEVSPPGFHYEKEHVGLWATLDFMLCLKRHMLETNPSDPSRIDACLGDAARIAEEIDILADNGDLGIMQDTSSCMASSLVVLLRKVFHLASMAQKSLIITLLQRILVAYNRAAGNEINTATAYVARFVRRTLRAIGTESRAASPLREQITGGNMLGEDDQPDFMLQLQELMRMPEEPVGMNDDDYW